MTFITYTGLAVPDFEIINSAEFQSVLKAHPELRLVLTGPGGANWPTGELMTDIGPVLEEEPPYYVGIIDTNDNNFMFVLHDDFWDTENPSAGMVEILKLMDAYFTSRYAQRIFWDDEQLPFGMADESLLTVEYDFTTGSYKLETEN